MAVLKPRNRIFLIRLTQDEYDALRTVSVDRGARNLSDFARSTLLASVGKGESGVAQMAEVCRTLSDLQETVGRMAERMEQMLQNEAPVYEAYKRK